MKTRDRCNTTKLIPFLAKCNRSGTNPSGCLHRTSLSSVREKAGQLASLAFAFLVLLGCARNQLSESEQIMRLLESCPSWTVPPPNDVAKAKILDHLAKISAYNTTLIYEAVKKYSAMHRDDLEALSKILLLNRFLFAVPQWVPVDTPLFGSWRHSVENGQISLLWPFSVRSDGTLVLTGEFSGYTGEPYQAREEFDFFSKNYGQRRNPGSVDRKDRT